MVSSLPFISVLMPVRNEGNFIRESLGAVLKQNYPQENFEIVVIDGMSSDNTRTIISGYQKSYCNVRLIDNPSMIVAPGLNEGIRQAKGDILIRVDGHTIIASDYMMRCVEKLGTGNFDNVGGRMDAVGENFFGEVVASATSSFFGVGGSRFHYSQKEELVDSVYMGAWPKRTFEKFGYFDEELVRNQDDEFNYRIRKMGGSILLSPHIKSQYFCRSSWKLLARQYFQYGFWKVRVMQKHPRQMSLRQFIPALFVGGLVTGLIFNSLFPLFLRVLAGSYTVVNLGISLFESLKSRGKHFFYLPIVYATLHFSYGAGFLMGLVKFRHQWKN